MSGRLRIWHIVVLCIGLALIGTGLTLWFHPPGAQYSRGEMEAIAHERWGTRFPVQSITYIGDGKWKVKVVTGVGILYFVFEERYGKWY